MLDGSAFFFSSVLRPSTSSVLFHVRETYRELLLVQFSFTSSLLQGDLVSIHVSFLSPNVSFDRRLLTLYMVGIAPWGCLVVKKVLNWGSDVMVLVFSRFLKAVLRSGWL